MKPKADYTDNILKNKGLVPITAIAKDYGMSGVATNAKLHEMRIIYKMGSQWLLYSRNESMFHYMNKELNLHAIVRRKKPNYQKGTVHKVFEARTGISNY